MFKIVSIEIPLKQTPQIKVKKVEGLNFYDYKSLGFELKVTK